MVKEVWRNLGKTKLSRSLLKVYCDIIIILEPYYANVNYTYSQGKIILCSFPNFFSWESFQLGHLEPVVFCVTHCGDFSSRVLMPQGN